MVRGGETEKLGRKERRIGEGKKDERRAHTLHISCVKECSDVSAVNSDPGEAPGDSTADQTLSNTSIHISFLPSGDSQLSDKSAIG